MKAILTKTVEILTNPTWSSLSFFGNSALAKAAIFAPVVAIYVDLNSKYLADTFGFTNAIWLYWSLLLIGSGQLIYTLACPRVIRNYGDDFEKFILEAKSSWIGSQFNEVLCDRFISYLPPNGPFELPAEVMKINTTEEIAEHYAGFGTTQNGHRDREERMSGWRLLEQFQKNPYAGAFPLQSVATVQEYTMLNSSLVFDQDRKSEFDEFAQLVRTAQKSNNTYREKTQEELITSNLSWLYVRKNNLSKPIIRTIMYLYLVGSIYFVFRAIASLLRMIANTVHAII